MRKESINSAVRPDDSTVEPWPDNEPTVTHTVNKGKKGREINLQVDVLTVDGEVDEVFQSAHLGNKAMKYNEEEDWYECIGTGYNKDTECYFELDDLGSVEEREVIVAGMHDEVKDTPPINALTFLDEPEKLEALNEDEKEMLMHITALELKAISNEAHEDDISGWTPLQNAVIAILQHPDVPEAQTISVHNTEIQKGNRTLGSSAILTVGGHEFDCNSPYYAFTEYKVCDDKRELYRFTWMGVPQSFLKE